MILDSILKKEITDFLINRGLEQTQEGFSWNNPLTYENTDTLKSELERTKLFFNIRNYNFISDTINGYLIKGKPKIAGIQAYSKSHTQSFLDLFYCTRFEDLMNDQSHYPGFFMLGLHSFHVKNTTQILFHLESIFDFFNDKGINRLVWDRWSDGISTGSSIEFYHDELEIGNMVFITEKNGLLLSQVIIDIGIGWERYLGLVSVEIPSREVLLVLTCIISFLNGLKPGRRGVSDNIKRIYRITPLKNLDLNIEEACKYWLENTSEQILEDKKKLSLSLYEFIKRYSQF